MDMGIAAMSVNMHQQETADNWGIGVMKMAMDTAESGAVELLEDLPSIEPNLGTTIDIQA